MIAQAGHEAATLGGGCFWCLEAVFKELRGVVSVMSGYAGPADGDVAWLRKPFGGAALIDSVRAALGRP